ncbi:unnamed protein product [Brassica oleracea]
MLSFLHIASSKAEERERELECLSAPIGTKTLSFSRPFSAFSPLTSFSAFLAL